MTDGSDEVKRTLAATGNGIKSHDLSDTFLDVSAGGGNHGEPKRPEVHLTIRSNDEHQHAQSWFYAGDLLAALGATIAAPSLQMSDEEWRSFQSIPDQGHSHRAWIEARIAERVAATQAEALAVVKRACDIECRSPGTHTGCSHHEAYRKLAELLGADTEGAVN